jgi:hypothetical protein
VKSALRLAALDENAVRLGLRPGQPLADARAMIPALETVAEDSAADRALVEGIADWAERYTPLVALDADNGLILDITGAAHLLGGEEALLADLMPASQRRGSSHARRSPIPPAPPPLPPASAHARSCLPAARQRCSLPCRSPPFASAARRCRPWTASA